MLGESEEKSRNTSVKIAEIRNSHPPKQVRSLTFSTKLLDMAPGRAMGFVYTGCSSNKWHLKRALLTQHMKSLRLIHGSLEALSHGYDLLLSKKKKSNNKKEK